MEWEQRIRNYQVAFPHFPHPVIGSDGRLQGIWILGQNYKSKSGYYGSYPPNFLDRVIALFPELRTEQALHLFSGSLTKEQIGAAKRIDVNGEFSPEYHGDFLDYDFGSDKFTIILADPPYSIEDAVHYGTPMVNRNKVVRKCARVLVGGGILMWLDQVLPMYRKSEFDISGLIGISRSTNHRFRCLVIFERLSDGTVNCPSSHTLF